MSLVQIPKYLVLMDYEANGNYSTQYYDTLEQLSVALDKAWDTGEVEHVIEIADFHSPANIVSDYRKAEEKRILKTYDPVTVEGFLRSGGNTELFETDVLSLDCVPH